MRLRHARRVLAGRRPRRCCPTWARSTWPCRGTVARTREDRVDYITIDHVERDEVGALAALIGRERQRSTIRSTRRERGGCVSDDR